MLKAVGLFGGRNKKSPPLFKDYYAEWISTLKTTLLPSLHQSISDTSPSSLPHLSLHVEALHRHFQSYYDSLDAAAQNDVAQILFPDWRNPLEKPFLWLADLHPYLFTNLLRSFLDANDDDDSDDDSLVVHFGDRPWHVATAWRTPSDSLAQKVEQVECGLRLMVPALAARARDAQAAFVERVAKNWGPYDGGKKEASKAVMAEAMEAEMEEMVSVVLDANRLRRSVLAEIIGATSVYQAALFLEGLAQFLVGFRNPELLAQFDQCKTPLSKQCRLAV